MLLLDKVPMLTTMKKPLIIILALAVLIVLVTATYFAYMQFFGTQSIPIRTFVCADGSHYIVIEEKDKILVSGNVFLRIDKSSRFTNGTSEVELTEEMFTLRSGESSVTCNAGVPESGPPPILN